MEKIIVYVDDGAQAQQQLVPMKRSGPDSNQRTHWVLVACAPRMTHRISKWVSHSARENWRAKWADKLFAQIVPALQASGDLVTIVLAKGPLPELTAQGRAWSHAGAGCPAAQNRHGSLARSGPTGPRQNQALGCPWRGARHGRHAVARFRVSAGRHPAAVPVAARGAPRSAVLCFPAMKLLSKWLLSAAALLLVAYLYSGVQVSSFTAALVAAFVIGLFNIILRPVLVVLTLPVTLVTLGLFLFVINALMFWAAAYVLDGFQVSGFVGALLGSLIYSVLGIVIESALEGLFPQK